jgi:hypothetical protein
MERFKLEFELKPSYIADHTLEVVAHLVAPARRHHVGVVAYGCVSGPHHTPIWVEGLGGYL